MNDDVEKLRDAIGSAKPRTAMVAKDAYYEAMQGLVWLNKALEQMAPNDDLSHPLWTEHARVSEALGAMKESLLGKVL